nr:MAG TPA: hypothetical protein [Caudoviricetes sp.]
MRRCANTIMCFDIYNLSFIPFSCWNKTTKYKRRVI